MELALLKAMSYLKSKVESGQVSFEKLEEFALQDWPYVPDCDPNFELDFVINQALKEFARAVAQLAEFDQAITIQRMVQTLIIFREKMVKRQITPVTLAILCNCSASDFE